MIKIKRLELNKLIKFSQNILITENKIYFIKYDDETKKIVQKSLNYKTDFVKNKICFISKDIKNDLDVQGNVIEILIDDNYISFNNLKIQLLESVVRYV